jgi:radical SAM-linked protein
MRIRLTFTKLGMAKYSSHLDLHKTWERTLRRAGAPLAYSQGFNPQPRMQLAAALPLGFTSECEVMDVWLEGQPDLAALRAELDRAAPPGIRVLTFEAVDERLPALQTLVRSAEYRVTVETAASAEELESRVAGLLAAASLPRERRGKPYDLRPLIETLAVEAPDPARPAAHGLRMQLAAREGATGRPEEVLAALGLDPATAGIHRLKLHFGEGKEGKGGKERKEEVLRSEGDEGN